jgi:hypothetical protein
MYAIGVAEKGTVGVYAKIAGVGDITAVKNEGEVHLHPPLIIQCFDLPITPAPRSILEDAIVAVDNVRVARSVEGKGRFGDQGPIRLDSIHNLPLPALRPPPRIVEYTIRRIVVGDVRYIFRIEGEGSGGLVGAEICKARCHVYNLRLPRDAVVPGVIDVLTDVGNVWVPLTIELHALIADVDPILRAIDALAPPTREQRRVDRIFNRPGAPCRPAGACKAGDEEKEEAKELRRPRQ